MSVRAGTRDMSMSRVRDYGALSSVSLSDSNISNKEERPLNTLIIILITVV